MKHNVDEELELKAALHALGTMTQNEAKAYEEAVSQLASEETAGIDSLAEFDSVVHLLGFAAEEAEPSPVVWDKLSAMMTEEPKVSETLADEPISNMLANSEVALDEIKHAAASPALLTIRKDEGEWLTVSEGVFVKPIFQNPDRGTSTYLIKMSPGTNIERHRHSGFEECMMIEGDFHVDGKVLGPGDYHCASPGSIHDRPYTETGTLFLVVASARYESLEN
ncbi:MAG: cupin domain-containing protein [Acidobacteriota bacterium]